MASAGLHRAAGQTHPTKPAATSGASASLAGNWRAGASSVEVDVKSWGADCGPRPESSRSAGGGMVTLLHDGKQVIIHTRDQELRSDACWSRNPLIHKLSSSVADGVWTTQCKTATSDPREEHGTYTLKVMGPDTLLYQDVSHYNWALNTSKCVATFTTTQTLARVRDGAVQPAPVAAVKQAAPTQPSKPAAAEATLEPVEKVCKPGAPAQLALRPKKAALEVGQRVCFRARVSDASDCLIPTPPVEWSLAHSKAIKGELADGCFTAARSAAEAEGDFKIVATALGLRAEAAVSVHSVDLSGLIAKRMESGQLNTFDEQAAPAPAAPKAVARITTRTVTEHGASGNKLWLAVGGGLCVALLVAAGVLLRRKPTPSPARASSTHEELAPTPWSPLPARTADAPRQASGSGAPPTLLAASPVAASTPSPASAEPWICPLCRLGYPAERKVCPKDGTPLMPYAEFNQRSRATEGGRQRRCPKCGNTFAANTTFCGDDGTTLVDV
ncbi:MAG TPA: hypothetical protein VF331_21255 [Polyangiales bacterium]